MLNSLVNLRTHVTTLPFGLCRVLISLVLVSGVCAQYRLDTWTTDNGLPQNSVTGLTQTPDQYISLTTNDGLVRFDGVRFTVFNKSNTPEISSNRLSSAFVDKMGRLWFRGEDGSILFRQNGAFTVAAGPRELQPGTLSRFLDDGVGAVVINRDRQPYQFQNGRFVPLTVEGIEENSPVIAAGPEKGLWFSSRTFFTRTETTNLGRNPSRVISTKRTICLAMRIDTAGSGRAFL